MEKYGKIYDSSVLTSTDEIHTLISEYFDNPIMTKIKNDENQTIYICKIHSLLMNKKRYIIASVDKNKNNIGHKEHISNLNWHSFQTRTLDNNYDIEKHGYDSNFKKLDYPIIIKDRNNKISEYYCEKLNIKIYLLHKKENNLYEYSDKGNLKAAIETYNTIITI